MNKDTGLDERETYLLDILFEECGGDFSTAFSKSGYTKDISLSSVRKKLAKEIKARTKDYIISQTPKAAYGLVNVLIDPNQLGAKNVISAAKEILDRGDVNKEEHIFEMPDNIIVLLPPKRVPPEITLKESEYKEIDGEME